MYAGQVQPAAVRQLSEYKRNRLAILERRLESRKRMLLLVVSFHTRIPTLRFWSVTLLYSGRKSA